MPGHAGALLLRGVLLVPVDDSATRQVVGRQLDDDPVLLLVAEHHHVDLVRTGKRLEGTLTPAPTALVERITGQPIDGTAPLGHPTNLPTWVDTALAAHPEVWAAGGHPNTVFRTNFRELVRITAGLPIDID